MPSLHPFVVGSGPKVHARRGARYPFTATAVRGQPVPYQPSASVALIRAHKPLSNLSEPRKPTALSTHPSSKRLRATVIMGHRQRRQSQKVWAMRPSGRGQRRRRRPSVAKGRSAEHQGPKGERQDVVRFLCHRDVASESPRGGPRPKRRRPKASALPPARPIDNKPTTPSPLPP